MIQQAPAPVPTVTETRAARSQAPAWLAVIVACLFAGLIPETIATSSTAVLKIIVNPFSVVYIAVFYGTAMLVMREAIVRKPASWVSVVLLGIAFGFCNEGVVAGTWYTQLNKGYYYFGQVDIGWAAGLTVFHLFISMLTTIAFTSILFPSYAGRSLLGKRGTIVAGVIFVVFTGLVVFAPTYREYRLLVFGIALLIAWIALLLPPARQRTPVAKPLPRFWTLRFAGFFAMVCYFLVLYFTPRVTAGLPGVPIQTAQFIDIAIFVIFSALLIARGLSWMRRAGWGLRQNLALITGALFLMVLLSVLVPPLFALLEPLATVPFLIFLIVLDRRLSRLSQAQTLPASVLST